MSPNQCSPPEEVVRIAEDAQATLPAWFSAPDILPYASAAIAIVRDHPAMQPEFEAAFISLVGRTPSEFLEVCAHALRWDGLKREFEARCRAAVERNDWRTEPVYRHLLEAFEDDWEDATDFYASYFQVG